MNRGALVCFLCCVCLQQAHAAKSIPDSKISAKLTLGLERDSYLAVDELDIDPIQNDVALQLAAGLKYSKPLSDRDKLKFKYNFSQRNYDEFSSFDRLSHAVSAEFTRKYDNFKIGTKARFVQVELDSENLFELNQWSAFASRFISQKYYLRGGYQFTDKDYATRNQRDAKVNAVDLSMYGFLDDRKDYWALTLKAADEDASRDRFDRSIVSLEARYHGHYQLFDQALKAKFYTRFQVRDHSSITPSIGEKRNDDRFRAGSKFELSLGNNRFLVLQYEYSDYRSNLPSADYSQNKVDVQFGWRYQ